jgi:ADP-heptose:LPS heptosyltransferase
MNDESSKNILIIQTAFIGDTILASHFARAVKDLYPQSKIHFFLRKGNESVIEGLPTIDKVWIWDKQGGKAKNLFKLVWQLRKVRFDMVFNLHRHFNSGLVTVLMKSPFKVGFAQNPLSFLFHQRVKHLIPHQSLHGGWHEVQRNLQLLQKAQPSYQILEDAKYYRPQLPLKEKHFIKVAPHAEGDYFVVAPASVWFTKAWSEHKYRQLTQELSKKGRVIFIGAPSDRELCERIRKDISHTENLCGTLSLLDSAALMKNAIRVFVNDSAPLHLASCVNAKTTAIFCSTIKEFGYTPLAQDSIVIDVGNSLPCRPCGLHGHPKCPLGHFKCAENIEVERVLSTVTKL